MVSITTEGIDEGLAEFRELPTRLIRATVRSLNRGIASASTFMSRAMAKDMALKVGDIKKALRLEQASPGTLTARLTASTKRIPLIEFNARGPEPSRGKGKGVSYNLRGGRQTIPNAFIATMTSGHRGVFVRIGKGRRPVKELFGPSLGQVFEIYQHDGQRQAEDAFLKNFDHELAYATPSPEVDDAGA